MANKWRFLMNKGVVLFLKKKTFAGNLLTPMSSKMSMSFFSRKEIKDFLYIMDFNGNQTVQGPNERGFFFSF